MTDEKVVIITGASRGIGAALVSAFAEAGYAVVANARTIASSTNPKVVAVPGDVGDPVTAGRVVDEAVQRFGRLDSLVNDAGIYISKPFGDYTQADYDALLTTNIAGFFHLTQRALHVMEQQGWGHVLTITATIAEQPVEGVPTALASLTKGGLNAATKALAIEYAARGIRVNAVSPGVIDTSTLPEPTPSASGTPAAVPRMGHARDVVAAVLYLERAAFVTGEISHVDGGRSAGCWSP
ncbi:MAG TPA: SDR family oxidoreductase [Candidatus Baltobacteraceae bacterium]|nr:SDR family oxidoreductase [Candidatus Baltobacteraceae bacterium]